ncbi:MAG: membrane-bound lytic murein transglycosylase MltF, partial [Gammaproteobacteria bacterium]|nr:membrane-bound lytic murein transglycosylase MltF [Gammaproteobacteria bacterium]
MRRVIWVLLAVVLSTCSQSPSTLEEVLETGQLRVITRNSPTTFYRGPFGFEGPEYDRVEAFRARLEEKFARTISIDYQTADTLNEIFAALESGRAHIAAASLTITDDRRQRVAFAPAYQTVSQYLVYRLNSGRPRSLDALAGKSLEVISGSSFAETLTRLQQEHSDLAWGENPHAETSDLLLAVQEREIDYTVVDSNDYYVHRYYMPDLRKAFKLKEDDKLAWALHPQATALLDEIETFFAAPETGELMATIKERYYGHTNRFDYVGTRTFKRHYVSRLPNYIDLFHTAEDKTGIDWRLLAAIGYQESHWDPTAVSPTGVRGMMMLTSATAGGLGVQDRHDAAESVAAGAQYFRNIYNRLEDIPDPDRTWFALAAYNVGYGHLQDARRLARRRNKDPDSWVVIREMLPLLTKREYYSQVPHGYARGWEPVRYVRNIRTYYD